MPLLTVTSLAGMMYGKPGLSGRVVFWPKAPVSVMPLRPLPEPELGAVELIVPPGRET